MHQHWLSLDPLNSQHKFKLVSPRTVFTPSKENGKPTSSLAPAPSPTLILRTLQSAALGSYGRHRCRIRPLLRCVYTSRPGGAMADRRPDKRQGARPSCSRTPPEASTTGRTVCITCRLDAGYRCTADARCDECRGWSNDSVTLAAPARSAEQDER